VDTAFQDAVESVGLPVHWRWNVVLRPNRRTLGLVVARDGAIEIAVPPEAKPADIAVAVRQQTQWLAQAVLRRTEASRRPVVKDLADGEEFQLLGQSYRLRLVERSSEGDTASLQGDWLLLPRPSERGAAAAALIAWYSAQTHAWASRCAVRLAGSAGVATSPIRVRDLGGRWGAREKDGAVTLHWAVIQLPPPLVEFVLAHEIAHLRIATHGKEFNRELRTLLPDADLREQQLADLGRGIWFGRMR
jgi:predicted metal-dependent hydrolase